MTSTIPIPRGCPWTDAPCERACEGRPCALRPCACTAEQTTTSAARGCEGCLRVTCPTCNGAVARAATYRASSCPGCRP